MAAWRPGVLVLLVSLIFAQWKSGSNSNHNVGISTVPDTPLRDIDGLFIVRFRDYQLADNHRSRLSKALHTTTGWEWIERYNAAAKYPTDFGLVRMQQSAVESLKTSLKTLSFVKDIHPERILHLAPLQTLSTTEETNEENEEEQPWQQQQQQQFTKCSDDDTQQQEGKLCLEKRAGRLSTRPTFSLTDNLDDNEDIDSILHLHNKPVHNGSATLMSSSSQRRRRLLQENGPNLAKVLGADKVWAKGHRGAKVKMGVFDTGIKGDHPDVKNIRERTNWTHEPTLEDRLGHGSFVAGVVAGHHEECPGLAPDVELYTFRVFTNDQVSYTSWFLDAFNYAIASEMNIVNLSIGGPDWLDAPFVEKVLDVTSRGIIMVSAIGNDGPLYGTLNNPADQNDVIGIGGIDYQDQIAPFSSRGMTTWELPLGYGRAKPDIVTYGRDVMGSKIGGGCRALSGTSVASPVVAGAVCLLASTIPEKKRWKILNPASMKQALLEGAARLDGPIIYEQGAGKLDVLASMEVLAEYEPRASAVPAQLDLTLCPYMWPFCRQPMYANAQPVMFNVTVLNGMGVSGTFVGTPQWIPGNEAGKMLDIAFDYFPHLWPWSGYIGVLITVKPEAETFNGTAVGEISFEIESPPAVGETKPRRSIVVVPVKAEIAPTPQRAKRVLWDQFHSIRYPPAYMPRDDLAVRHDILDWHGDHPHTNYHDMYNRLRDAGYYLEVLASPFTCFDATQYGTLLIVDSEDEFYPEEIVKLTEDITDKGLAVFVFADWYDVQTMHTLRFFDDNTRSWWDAATGGANVPALNDLLKGMGVMLEGGTFDGPVNIGVPSVPSFNMASGSAIAVWPVGGYLYNATANNNRKHHKGHGNNAAETGIPVLGLTDIGTGKLLVYGDSNCLDSSHQRSNCYDFLITSLSWATENGTDLLREENKVVASSDDDDNTKEYYGSWDHAPLRRDDYNFTQASLVLSTPLKCYINSVPGFTQLLETQQKQRSSEEEGDNTAVHIDGEDDEEEEEEDDIKDVLISGGNDENTNDNKGAPGSSSREIAQQQKDDALQGLLDDDNDVVDDRDRDSPASSHHLDKTTHRPPEETGSGGDGNQKPKRRHQQPDKANEDALIGMTWFVENGHLSRAVTILGTLGFVTLWSRSMRRRRSTMTRQNTGERAPLSPLPVFARWQQPRVRAE